MEVFQLAQATSIIVTATWRQVGDMGTVLIKLKQVTPVSVFRDRGPAAGSGSSGGCGSGTFPRTATGAEKPAGPSAKLRGVSTFRGS